MILKFIHRPAEVDDRYSERFVDCFDFLQIYDATTDHGACFQVIDKDMTISRDIHIDCRYVDVYVMSDTGKTVDSFKWRTVNNITKRV